MFPETRQVGCFSFAGTNIILFFNIIHFFLIFCTFFVILPDFPYFSPYKPIKLYIMPVQKVPGGWRWGQSGKVYPTKAQAEAQARAIYASGYREKSPQPKKK